LNVRLINLLTDVYARQCTYKEQENIAINDIATARRDSINANFKSFWGPGTPATQCRWLRLHSLCGTTLFGSHQLHLLPSVWLSLVGLPLLTFVCDTWQRSMQNAELTDGG